MREFDGGRLSVLVTSASPVALGEEIFESGSGVATTRAVAQSHSSDPFLSTALLSRRIRVAGAIGHSRIPHDLRRRRSRSLCGRLPARRAEAYSVDACIRCVVMLASIRRVPTGARAAPEQEK